MMSLQRTRLLATRTALPLPVRSRGIPLRQQSTQSPLPSTPPQAASPGRTTIADASNATPSHTEHHSNTFTSPSPSSPPPPSQKSKHKLVYREIWPPLLRVLSYASIVYFSLQLSWNYLDGREQRQLEDEVRQELENEVRKQVNLKAEQDVVVKTDAKTSRGWFSWASGQ